MSLSGAPEDEERTLNTDTKRVQVERAGSPVPSCVSVKSEHSMDRPIYLKGEVTGESRVHVKRAGSPVPSCLSVKSDHSMDRPIYLKGEFTGDSRVRVKREASPVASCRQRFRSMDPPLDIRGEFSGGQRIQHSLESSSLVEMGSDKLSSPKKITVHILRNIKQKDLADSLERDEQLCESVKRAQQTLKTHLSKKFECIVEDLRKQGHPTLLNEIYTELYITEGGSGGVNNEHEVRHIERASKKWTTQETAIICNDIFQPLPGQENPIRTVLTKGIAGIGKTVSVQKFILDWAEGKANQDADFIFALPFRDLNLKKGSIFSLMELLQHYFPQLKEITSIEHNEIKIVFIFDGLDECRLPLDFQSDEICCDITEPSSVDVLLTNLIKGNLLPSALLWITSRPAAANQIPSECVHRLTEIRGFNDPQKEEYFRKSIRDQNLASRVISHIKLSRSLYIMCHIPVFCSISATVLEKMLGKVESKDLPKTLTEMYTHFLLIQTNVKNQKYHGSNKATPKKISASDTEIILKLGQLAFLQLEKGNLIFYEEDLKESGIDVSEASVYSGLCTEIFKEECGLHQQKVYTFVHLSMQEYLAALFVFHSWVNENKNVLSPGKGISQEEAGEKDGGGDDNDDFHQDDDDDKEEKPADDDFYDDYDVNDDYNVDEDDHDDDEQEEEEENTDRDDDFYDYDVNDHFDDDDRHDDEQKNIMINTDRDDYFDDDYVNDYDVDYDDEQEEEKENTDRDDYFDDDYVNDDYDVDYDDEQEEEKENTDGDDYFDDYDDEEWADRDDREEGKEKADSGRMQLSELHRNAVDKSLESKHGHLDLFLRFFLGLSLDPIQTLFEGLLTQTGSRSVSIEKTVQYIKIKIEEESSAERTINLFHCLSELQNNFLVEEIQNSLRSGKLSDKVLEPHQCSALAFVLLMSEEVLDKFDLRTYKTSGAGHQRLVPVVRNCKNAILSNCDLTEESCEVVASALQSSNSPMTHLDFSYNNLRDSGVKLLCAGLMSPHCKLQRLGLKSCDLTEESCGSVASAVRSSNSSLRELDLSYNNVGDSGVKLLCAGLMNPNCKLMRLDLSDCNLGNRGMMRFCAWLLSPNCKLQRLDLSYNNLGDSGVELLRAGLMSPNCKLQTLGLSSCDLTKKSCKVVASALQSPHSTLRDLDLGYNSVGDSGMKLLCTGLMSQQFKLQRLHLNSCDLTAKSCDILASALRSLNSALRELDLSYNNLGDSGVKLLCGGLMSPNCKLQRLGLGWCKFTESCCDVLTSVLHSPHSLVTDLELRDNELQDSGVRALSAGLEDPNCKLQRLGLSGCRVTQRGCDSLASALCSNPSHLRELDLRYNHPGDSGVRALSATELDGLTLLVDHGGENRNKPGPRKYGCQLTLDPNTANKVLSLSEGFRKVTHTPGREEPYPDHPERFESVPQVVCRERVSDRCYWEAEFSLSEGMGAEVSIAVTYEGISRKGKVSDCEFGGTINSWSLECYKHSYSVTCVRHNKKQIHIRTPSPYHGAGVCDDDDGADRGVCVYRVGVCVDRPAGTLSFYSISDCDTPRLLHRFHTHFAEHTPLCAGFGVWNSSVSLCQME